MKFAAVIEYARDRERVQSLRPAHREYLKALLRRGQLVAAGPFTDDSGALIVYEAGSPEEAEGLLRADPFHQSGIFVRWQLRPWNAVLANTEAFPGGAGV
jgi:uncharacterized protein